MRSTKTIRVITAALVLGGAGLLIPGGASAQVPDPDCNGIKPKKFNAQKKNVTTKQCTQVVHNQTVTWPCVTGYDMYLDRKLCSDPPRARETRKKHCTETGGDWYIEEYRNGDCGISVGICKAPTKGDTPKVGGKNAVVTDQCTPNP